MTMAFRLSCAGKKAEHREFTQWVLAAKNPLFSFVPAKDGMGSEREKRLAKPVKMGYNKTDMGQEGTT